MKTLTHGQLFAGIGGFGLAAQWAGIDNIWANEIDPFACKVLTKNFPNTTIYEKDIRQITKETTASVDIISGGFPCQPFSQAGKRKGKDDNRYLWPEMLRVIRELQPTYVIGENVAGLLSMENGETLKTILSDLENEGYNNEVFLIPACAKGAWHRRDRLWICSHSTGMGCKKRPIVKEKCREWKASDKFNNSNQTQDVPNTDTNSTQGMEQESQQGRYKRQIGLYSGEGTQCTRSTQSSMGGMADGVSYWMDRYWEHEPEGIPRVAKGVKDRVHRLKGLGNAIVPQVAYELFKTIQSHYFY